MHRNRSARVNTTISTLLRVEAAGAQQQPALRRRLHATVLAVVLVMLTGISAVVTARPAEAVTLPAGFQESVVFSGLTNPTAVRFSNDGRVFVAEKRGVIKVFDSLTDTDA